ncbi:MAG: ABC transporter permease subunit [Cyanobacteria bacterium]|nr:ABC transporter permease subunit [Cyanobacteriota bacterium]
MAVVLAISGAIPIVIVGTITVVFAYQSWLFFRQVSWVSFLSDTRWTPLFSSQQYGISVLLSATLIISAIALAVALPLGVLAAIYLSEYAPGWIQQIVRPLLATLAGIPTIAYGYFALLFVTPQLQRLLPQLAVFNSLSAGLVTGLLIIPIVAGLSEDALRAVPQVQRQAAYACSFNRQELITQLLLPAALPGIMAASMLAASRALGKP